MEPSGTSAGREWLTGVPEGLDAYVLARLAENGVRIADSAPTIMHVARDDRRLDALERGLAFFAPKTRVISFPAWDTVPYDRTSPRPEIVARRISALARLAAGRRKDPTVVLTTINGVLQRVPSRAFIKSGIRQVAPGQRIDGNRFTRRLNLAGYVRTGTVMEPGEYAVRGGLIDLFPPGRAAPVRLDFFGDTLESIKSFDPETQRTNRPVSKLVLMPVSELAFGDEVERRFRRRYVELFGAVTGEDQLYEAVSAGQRFQGMEHWLPLFHEEMETIFDYLPNVPVSFDAQASEAIESRKEQIAEHYEARVNSMETETFGAPVYKPVPADLLYLSDTEWRHALGARRVRNFTPFTQPETTGSDKPLIQPVGGKVGRTFAAERQADGINVFDAVIAHAQALSARKLRVIIGCWSNGARERLEVLLREHGAEKIEKIASFAEALALPEGTLALATLGLEHGFEADTFALIAEQDVLGDRLVRTRRRNRKAADVLTEATSLSTGDLVVHADHGIGRFVGLKTITAIGAPHDCLELKYHGGDTLFLPVENIELLSRYGPESGTAQLDRLGGSAWQSRKARLKKRLREIAGELIKIAALRELRSAPVIEPPDGSLGEFVARFAHEETEDQDASIDAVMEDLGSGRPMDRLICGDVGFGKTEVALRAAFAVVMSGRQVAVVVPTTLLARQHFQTFSERFEGYPVQVAQASRLVAGKQLTQVKQGLKDGKIDIVVGTHALLGKTIGFSDLGLLIIDEEQHFGVQHKERLKRLREDVHVLTLTATPIPRTLQLALSGVRELSLITTPPMDRLAVRTYIMPVDPMILKDALLRERFRGGQSFYVVPRIADLDDVREFLQEHTPDLRVATAHGQLSAGQLEDVMTAFYDGKFDVLLSTAIVESGLDIPNANTMIVHRADMFGLAQLYQLRGRVGRSKTRAYAYFTTPAGQRLTEGAEKRLKVLQSLDSLGAGFSLASHDLDIRGAGNLLGEEQSGHIREVGFELYQSMLEEAVASLRGGDEDTADQWSPQIGLGTAVLIPETYVADLSVRLGLYRRLSSLGNRPEIEEFAAELADRFGSLPEEVSHLLDIVEIKALCRTAGVSQIEAGPKGAVIAFRRNTFANPEALIELVGQPHSRMHVQPDQKLVYRADFSDAEARLRGVRDLVMKLATMAGEEKVTA